MSYELRNREFDDTRLVLADFNPNHGYLHSHGSTSRTNLYTLLFPFQNLGDQLDSEIMPLRVQWALDQGGDILDPSTESWKRYKYLYGLQFGESKTVALFAPELSHLGPSPLPRERYDLGRYIRIVYLYVKPDLQEEFEQFVRQSIVPMAEKILAFRDEQTKAPPPDKRNYYKFGAYWRKLSMNVYMPTIPEFELFVQLHLVPAARATGIPMLTYRTVTGDRHNYHMFFPFNSPSEIHNDHKNLMVSSLLREHHLKSLPSLSRTNLRDHDQAKALADQLSSIFHSHLLDIEEVVFRTRPDMSAKMEGRYTQDSLKTIRSAFENGPLDTSAIAKSTL